MDNVNKLNVLPPLRSTLSITDGGFDFWSDRVWILSDKISNKHYYLGRVEYEILSRWHLGSIDKIVESLNAESIIKVKRENIEHIVSFLLNNNLLIVGSEVIQKIKSNKNDIVSNTVKNLGKIFYLKVPLINPDRFLEHTKHLVKPLFSKGFFKFIIFVFFLNIYLLASNWGSFSGGLPSFSDFSNLLLMLFILIGTKIIHELGHAYSCKIKGGKVPEMGVTFIFFYPLFYTDVSSSTLFNSKDRLIISTAGIRFELYLAIISGFLWFILPDMPTIKNLLFFVAALSWIISISINIIPFIKFDGYYILSDYLKIRNLSIRANAIFKYYQRRYVFGIQTILPESYSKDKYKFFLIFVILTAIYRVFLFSAILLFLYYVEFIGIPLFVLGLSILILYPIVRELINIWKLRSKIVYKKNIVISGIIFSFFILFLIVPLDYNVYLPAVYLAKSQRLYSPFEARVEDISFKLGKDMTAKQSLINLANPKLASNKLINLINTTTNKYNYTAAITSQEYRKIATVKQSDLDYYKTLGDTLDSKNQQLSIISPFDGIITAYQEGLYPNLWLANKAWLLDVVDFSTYYLQAFISNDKLQKYKNLSVNNNIANKTALFVPNNNSLDVCRVTLYSIANDEIDLISKKPAVTYDVNIAKTSIVNSNLLLFSSPYGGSVNLQSDENNNWVPVESYFTVLLTANSKINGQKCQYANNQIIKGTVRLPAGKLSIVGRVYELVKNALFS